MVEIVAASDINSSIFDVIIVVTDGKTSLAKFTEGNLEEVKLAVENFSTIFPSLDSGKVSLIPAEHLPSKRIIYSSTGSVHGDFDDVRRYTEAGTAAGKKLLETGARSPLLITMPSERFPNAQLATAIGFLHSLYTPFITREEDPNFLTKVDLLGILEVSGKKKEEEEREKAGLAFGSSLVEFLRAVQSSFDVCRDIGDGDPQRMSPSGVACYISKNFLHSDGSVIKVDIVDNVDQIRREFPLMAAVSRCANEIEEHKAHLIWLEYNGGGTDTVETLYLVGKGVTLDTGGVNVKTGAAMFGMSRDKYGSAVVAGFFRALDLLRPTGIKVVGCLCMCRNSIGSNAYTTDEIITARSGKRVHIGNTDAEGRMAMSDPLAKMKEMALTARNPHLFTIATLTGHALLTYGHCTAAMDNGPARAARYAEQLQAIGDAVGQPVEVSRLSNEDFDFHSSACDGADLKQAGLHPSVQTPRGHQGPAAFLIRASGLSECGLDSARPLKYTHLDIGACVGKYPETSMPSPLLALIAHHILPRTKLQSN